MDEGGGSRRGGGRGRARIGRRAFLFGVCAGIGAGLARAGGVAGFLSSAAKAQASPPSREPSGASAVLGKTGISVSRMAIGTGTSGTGTSSRQTRRLGVKGLADLLVHAHERGIRFIDAADAYGSHPHVRAALQTIPRKETVITTKTWARKGEEAEKALERYLRELGTDFIDIFLLHCLTDHDWNLKLEPVMEVLARAKRKGVIRAHGVSLHSLPALEAAAAEPWVDVALVRINYAGVEMDASPKEVIPVMRRMRDAGKGVYSMKVMGVGKLADDPEKAIAYQLSLPADAFVIGMVNAGEVDENSNILESLLKARGAKG